MRILVIEDETDLSSAIEQALKEEGFVVDVANEGESGLFNAEGWSYDAIILDLMLPGIDGWTILKKIRTSQNKTPVLILTARDAIKDRVKGLNSGADDYLTKPFSIDELIARVRSLIRRFTASPNPLIRLGNIEINTASRVVTKGKKTIELSAKEYALLELLVLNRGTLVTRTTIYDHIYNEDDSTLSNVVDVYVCNLRNKLYKDLIQTKRGHGYIIS